MLICEVDAKAELGRKSHNPQQYQDKRGSWTVERNLNIMGCKILTHNKRFIPKGCQHLKNYSKYKYGLYVTLTVKESNTIALAEISISSIIFNLAEVFV